jgi:Xaa-Pro aminopeptidase
MKSLTADFYTNNRKQLWLLRASNDPIVITASALLQQTTDIPYPFRQDGSFWYFTGINEPEAVLVIEEGGEYLILPPRSDFTDTFSGHIDIDKLKATSGIPDILDHKTGWERLSKRLKVSKRAAILPAPSNYIEVYAFYTNPAKAKLTEDILSHNKDLELVDIRPEVYKLRSIKQPSEIKQIEAAIDITGKALSEVRQHLAKDKFEYEVEARVIGGFYSHGSKAAFASIVSSGKKACDLHSEDSSGELSDADLVVIDVGAEVDHYCADITRTYARVKPTKRQEQVYKSVEAAQKFAYSLIKPGTNFREYETQVSDFVGKELVSLGLIKTINHDKVRRYFTHSTSHFLGLDPHDVGDYSQPMQEGMVITVEPGIYIPEEAIGVRIEDDVVITNKGIRILSADLPSTIN